jgi:hypothetical protein
MTRGPGAPSSLGLQGPPKAVCSPTQDSPLSTGGHLARGKQMRLMTPYTNRVTTTGAPVAHLAHWAHWRLVYGPQNLRLGSINKWHRLKSPHGRRVYESASARARGRVFCHDCQWGLGRRNSGRVMHVFLCVRTNLTAQSTAASRSVSSPTISHRSRSESHEARLPGHTQHEHPHQYVRVEPLTTSIVTGPSTDRREQRVHADLRG